MTVAAELLPTWLVALLWCGFALTCGYAVRSADWRALRAVPSRYHLVFGGSFCCLVLWLISINTVEGLWLHLLGMTSLTLLLGWHFAVLAGSIAVIAHTLLINQPLSAASAAWLLTVAVPATVSSWLLQRLRRLRSRNLFVYTLGAGFGGGLLSVMALAIVSLLLLWLCGQRSLVIGGLSNWPLIFLMMFPEGFINGMIVTTLTVFYPDLVRTFDDHYYLDDE